MVQGFCTVVKVTVTPCSCFDNFYSAEEVLYVLYAPFVDGNPGS